MPSPPSVRSPNLGLLLLQLYFKVLGPSLSRTSSPPSTTTTAAGSMHWGTAYPYVPRALGRLNPNLMPHLQTSSANCILHHLTNITIFAVHSSRQHLDWNWALEWLYTAAAAETDPAATKPGRWPSLGSVEGPAGRSDGEAGDNHCHQVLSVLKSLSWEPWGPVVWWCHSCPPGSCWPPWHHPATFLILAHPGCPLVVDLSLYRQRPLGSEPKPLATGTATAVGHRCPLFWSCTMHRVLPAACYLVPCLWTLSI